MEATKCGEYVYAFYDVQHPSSTNSTEQSNVMSMTSIMRHWLGPPSWIRNSFFFLWNKTQILDKGCGVFPFRVVLFSPCWSLSLRDVGIWMLFFLTWMKSITKVANISTDSPIVTITTEIMSELNACCLIHVTNAKNDNKIPCCFGYFNRLTFNWTFSLTFHIYCMFVWRW